MSVLDKVTKRATDNFADQNPNQAFDPSIIVPIAELVMQMVMMIQESCAENDPDGGLEIAQRPTRFQRWILRRRVRRELGWRGYRKHGSEIQKALLRTGRQTNIEEMRELYDEVG